MYQSESERSEIVARGAVLQAHRSGNPELSFSGGQKYLEPLSSWIEERKTATLNDELKILIKEPLVNRKDIKACGEWLNTDRMVRLDHVSGKFFHHMGVETDIGRCLYPEEAMHLLASGEITIMFEDESLSVSKGMELMLFNPHEYNMYLVYTHATSTGSKLVRHQPHLNFTKYEKDLRLDKHQEKKKKKKINIKNTQDKHLDKKEEMDEELDAFYASIGLDKNEKTESENIVKEDIQDIVLSPLKEYDKKKKELMNMIPNYIGRNTFEIPILDRDLLPENCTPHKSVYKLSTKRMNFYSLYEDSNSNLKQDYGNYDQNSDRGWRSYNSHHKNNWRDERNNGESRNHRKNHDNHNSINNDQNYFTGNQYKRLNDRINSESSNPIFSNSNHRNFSSNTVHYQRRDNRKFYTNSFSTNRSGNIPRAEPVFSEACEIAGANQRYDSPSQENEVSKKSISNFIEEMKNERKLVYHTDRDESGRYCPFSDDDQESNTPKSHEEHSNVSEIPTWKTRRRKKERKDKFPSFPSSLVRAVVKRVNNWQEYKKVLSTTNENSLLRCGLGAKLWEGHTKPLVKPSMAETCDTVFENCSIIKELNIDEKLDYKGDKLDLHYDVYFPNNVFKKATPTIPSARICVMTNELIPSTGKILEARKRFKDDVNVIIAYILSGRVRFYSINPLPGPFKSMQ